MLVTPEEFRDRRKEYGLTQAALAKLMGVSANTVARWERGERPLHEGLAKLAFKVLKLKRERQAGS